MALPLLPLVFYGSVGIVVLTLFVYPFIYASDAASASAYRSAPSCGSAVTINCRSRVTTQVTNVRSSDDQPEFDVVVGGKTLTVIRDSGAYKPADGDTAELEMWRGQPVRVFGPGGAEMITDQYPQSRLDTDDAVLGIFVVAGVFCLLVAMLAGWFGRRILFGRLIGMSRPQLLGGLAIVLIVAAVSVPVSIIGQASGLLPAGRAGGTILGLLIGGLIVLCAAVYALIRRLRSA